jgi:hypothetical protein
MQWLLAVLMLKVILFGTISGTGSLRGWTARNGHELLGNVIAAPPSESPKPRLSVVGPPDYKLLRHRASGFAADHPINRNYN